MPARKAKLDKEIPGLKVEATSGQSFKLSDLKGQKVVLYFYPKDATPGCTTESQDFRDQYAKFKRNKVAVFGISRDSLASHEKFKEKHGFPFELISDPDEKLCRTFDVIKEKNMYGKKVMGIERSTFIIDEAGVLRHEFRKVKIEGHVNAVLAALKAL